MNGLVYIVTNEVTGRQYIGQTRRSLTKRWREHLNGPPRCRLLSRAIAKHGEAAFSVKVLAWGLVKGEMDLVEKAAIQMYGTRAPAGYNLSDGGEGGNPSAETREKLAAAQRGRKRVFTDEHKANMSKAARAIVRSASWLESTGRPNAIEDSLKPTVRMLLAVGATQSDIGSWLGVAQSTVGRLHRGEYGY